MSVIYDTPDYYYDDSRIYYDGDLVPTISTDDLSDIKSVKNINRAFITTTKQKKPVIKIGE